ncbi:mlo-like protein 13 [Quercus suber]|uniref:MLO-like protein n=1 Tax=Quercus suber TaxID=58331 RepID=A0AAW0KT12_QUESU
MEAEINSSLEYTPTWIVASVCFVIVLISLCAARGIHHLGKYNRQDELNEALEKLKEELMLLGFISLLLTAFQGFISRMCIPTHLSYTMLPCKRGTVSSNGSEHYYNLATNNRRRLLSEDTNLGHCLHEVYHNGKGTGSFTPNKHLYMLSIEADIQLIYCYITSSLSLSLSQGKVPLISLEALHQLHIFIFVLAIFHVIFCVSTMVLGGVRIRQWKVWEDSIKEEISRGDSTKRNAPAYANNKFLKQHTQGFWRKAEVVSWLISFFKQFYGSVNRSDYTELRKGFIKEHQPRNPKFDFHKYIVRTLENDFKKIINVVNCSWYLWVFVVVFLLLNVAGWHSYFWLSFLPVILLLFVGAKLEHIITSLAQDAVESKINNREAQQVTEMTRDNSAVHNVVEKNAEDHELPRVKPSDKHFWFSSPDIVLDLLQFILFQNSFEIAFFVWILCIYGFNSCIMEKPGFIITRLVMGVIVQVLCSYCTIPLYALVTQMGSSYKGAIFKEFVSEFRKKGKFGRPMGQTEERQIQMQKMAKESHQNDPISEQAIVVIEETSTSITELTSVAQLPFTSS